MTGKRVSIKFCGGCNPRIDRGRVAKEVAQSLAPLGYEIFYNITDDVDYIVYISGCTVSCARKNSDTTVQFVTVAGTTINLMPADEEELANKIISKVRDEVE